MPRHPFRPELSEEIRQYAGLPAAYVTELSYQTETKKVWIVLTKGDKTLKHSVAPELKALVRQIGNILKAGKLQLDEDKKLSDYVDVTITLPPIEQTSQNK